VDKPSPGPPPAVVNTAIPGKCRAWPMETE
jgi:hypothetical protein